MKKIKGYYRKRAVEGKVEKQVISSFLNLCIRFSKICIIYFSMDDLKSNLQIFINESKTSILSMDTPGGEN